MFLTVSCFIYPRNSTTLTPLLLIALLLMGAGVPPAPPATPTWQHRFDAELRSIVRSNHPSGQITVHQHGEDEPSIDVIIRATKTITPELEALGIGVRTVLDSAAPVIITADVPISALLPMAAIPTLLSAEAAYPLVPLIDEAVDETLVSEAWKFRHGGYPLRGSGVLIAIVDSGIDYHHPTFWRADGSSRILEIWDQRTNGDTFPAGYRYGTLCTSDDIMRRTCPIDDTIGHGTHVASVAGGGGVDGHFVGVAPDADFIIVKQGNAAQTIDAWTYIIEKAKALNRPVVINNSFGNHDGPHDGTSIVEQAIDRLAGPGVLFVVGAGNSADLDAHAQGSLAANALTIVPIVVEPTPIAQSSLGLWYDGGTTINVSVIAPNGQHYGPVGPGGVLHEEAYDGRAHAGFSVMIDAMGVPQHHDNHVLIRIVWSSPPADREGWSVILHSGETVAPIQWNAWLVTSLFKGRGNEYFTGEHVSRATTLTQPATARRALSVASYITQTCWEAPDGRRCLGPSHQIGDISTFSSRGPTRDGRQKPDIAAPGQVVIGALSGAVRQPHILSHATADGLHVAQQGTSLAAPHISGILALLLQLEPSLTPEQARTILTQTARSAEPGRTRWDEEWGYGKVNALAAINEVRTTTPEAASTTLTCGPRMVLAEYFNTPELVSIVTNQDSSDLHDRHDVPPMPVVVPASPVSNVGLLRCEERIHHDWGASHGPIIGMEGDAFSARWSAEVLLQAGDYAVQVWTNDGARIMVGDQVVLDGWRDVMSRAHYTATFSIETSGIYPLRIEYYKQAGRASIEVQWQRLRPGAVEPDDAKWSYNIFEVGAASVYLPWLMQHSSATPREHIDHNDL